MAKNSKNKHEIRRANRDRRQRLEEMRKQQKAAERRKNLLFVGTAIVVGLALVGVPVGLILKHDADANAKKAVGYTAPVSAAEKAAGCTGVHNDPVSPPGQHTLQAIDYAKEPYGDTAGGAPPIPPSGGKHNPVPLSDSNRLFTLAAAAKPERVVHNLEHGYVVAWYDDKLPAAEVAKLKTLATDPTLRQLLVVGWTSGELPLGKPFVLTSWGRTERCATVSADVVKAFYGAHANTLAPEAGSGAGPASCPPDTLATDQPPCVPAPPSASGTPSASATPSASPAPTKARGKKH